MNKQEIKKHVEEGYLHVNILFEMIGSPKKHIEKTMEIFLKNIAEQAGIIKIKEEIEDAIALEDKKMFSIAAENEYLILGIEKLTWLSFNFMPASIEVLAPKTLTFKEKDFTNWLNDLLAKLHEVNTIHTALKSEHDGLVRNTNALIRNNILLALDKPLTANQLGEKIGIPHKQLLPFLEAMIKEQKITHKNKHFEKK